VLYDHWHDVNAVQLTNVFQADTALFIIMSGLTTALQLRDRPVVNNDDDVLLPRRPFNYGQFLVSRAVGIFPILWLVILINIPYWIEQTNARYSYIHSISDDNFREHSLDYQREVVPGCAVLHVVALETWWRPDCIASGPDTYYASIIWSIYLIAALFIAVLRHWVDYAVATMTDGSDQAVRGLLYALNFSRPDNPTTHRYLCLLWMVAVVITGVLSEVGTVNTTAVNICMHC
jgi:hypothetical protein